MYSAPTFGLKTSDQTTGFRGVYTYQWGRNYEYEDRGNVFYDYLSNLDSDTMSDKVDYMAQKYTGWYTFIRSFAPQYIEIGNDNKYVGTPYIYVINRTGKCKPYRINLSDQYKHRLLERTTENNLYKYVFANIDKTRQMVQAIKQVIGEDKLSNPLFLCGSYDYKTVFRDRQTTYPNTYIYSADTYEAEETVDV